MTAQPAVIGDTVSSALYLQQLFGQVVPLTVVSYHSAGGRQTYITSFGVFHLIVETRCEQLAPLRTRVITRYALGGAPIWMFLAPLARWSLTRNYHRLMKADLPMRERRGTLRSWGYRFRGDGQAPSPLASTRIGKTNLIPPEQPATILTGAIIPLASLRRQGHAVVGREDHQGLRLDYESTSNSVHVFPRTCPHEGAGLDAASCHKDTLTCPWHGRVLHPLTTFDADEVGCTETGFFDLQYDREQIRVLPKPQGRWEWHADEALEPPPCASAPSSASEDSAETEPAC
jgi:nitrite reductase/ring-hydroxylating ferredoxin subunit